MHVCEITNPFIGERLTNFTSAYYLAMLANNEIVLIIIIILGIVLFTSCELPKTYGSKLACLKEQSEGIAIKSLMSQIK